MLLEERCTGCMLGLAIGDALGYPAEFMNRDEIARAYGVTGITGFVNGPSRGCYSRRHADVDRGGEGPSCRRLGRP